MKKLLFIPILVLAIAHVSCEKNDAGTVTNVETILPVEFVSVTADGQSEWVNTTALTLTFDCEINGLTADDITIAENTVTKGNLTAKGDGVYELALTEVREECAVTLTVDKQGYAFTPASQTVTVFQRMTFESISYVGADTSESPDYFTGLTSTEMYIDFYPNSYYTLGSNKTPGSCALAVNRPMKYPLSRYEVKLTLSGGGGTTISVGYVTDLTDIRSYKMIRIVPYAENKSKLGTNYVVDLSTASGLPDPAYLAIHFNAASTWQNNNFHNITVSLKN